MAKYNSKTHRRCNVCKETKALVDFPNSAGRPLNKAYRCKPCSTDLACEYILKKYGTYRNRNLVFKYGISAEEFDKFYEEQQGLCKICNRARNLVVDHCHDTGNFRGLLCSGCNTGIGQFEHDPTLFDKAKEYICRN